MAYKITPEQAASITDAELAFATERLLPAKGDIPADFFEATNIYAALTRAIFFGRKYPECSVVIKDGFTAESLNKCVRAHLASFGPKHEHKIAGVAFMMSEMCMLIPEPEPEASPEPA